MQKIIIIGGGIAGLTAGIYAQKAGFQSVIYEKHTVSGGECTGWDRKGFHIDGCIHWLTGTKPGTKLYKLWEEVGALENVEIYNPESFTTVEHQGKTVTLWTNLEKLEKHLIEVSPEDKPQIQELIKYTQAYLNFEMPSDKPMDLMGLVEKIKLGMSMKDVVPVMNKLKKVTISEYLTRFKSPIIREALKAGIHVSYCAYTLPFTLATLATNNGGIPMGGSKAFALRMEEKYKSLGGKINLGQGVEEIIIENNTAKGVILKDGTKIHGDYIVPTCDTNITFNQLLKGKYKDNDFQRKYSKEENYPVFSGVYVALGVDADLANYPKDFLFDSPEFSFDDKKLNQVSMKNYSYDPTFAPKGKTVVISYINANYHWWKEKRGNIQEYKNEKEKLGEAIIERIENRFPELQGKITLIDVATPITFERYCGAYKGAYMSFGTTPKGDQKIHNGKIKGLKNFYMAGQWLMPPGGLPTALVTGKWAIQRICSSSTNLKL